MVASDADVGHADGVLPSIIILILPFLILWVLVKLLPPWEREEPAA